jgi:TonB-dependent receptor
MKTNFAKNTLLPAFSLSALSLAISAVAQEEPQTALKPIEEVVIVGRLQSGADSLVMERLEQEVAMDVLGSEFIGRVGDSNVAAALRRVPGITLIGDKFVYVRGLGERYSSSLLNGAVVPSPDLSRNVLPLDIFPTALIESIAVQKVHSSDMPAAFGGGTVDIRTKSIPNDFVLSLELGGALNTESKGDFLSYNGGGDDDFGNDDGTRALSSTLRNALYTYGGSLNRSDILSALRKTDSNATLADADAVNRQLATELYRDIGVSEVGGDQDFSGEINVGNRLYLGASEETEIGFLAGVAYNRQWRNANTVTRAPSDETEVAYRQETTRNVSLTMNLALGLRLNEEHNFETTSLLLRNTDDQVSITDSFDNDRPQSDGVSDRAYRLRYEQRELEVHQIRGEHVFGEITRDFLGLDALDFADGMTFNWFYSDSTSTTEIPNQVTVQGSRDFNAGTNTVNQNSSSGDFRFTDLNDEVESYGWELAMPFSTIDWNVRLSGGSEYWQKARTYQQTQFGLGTVSSNASATLTGPLNEVYSDANLLDPNLGYQISVVGSNSESYIAANRVNSYYGKLDVTWLDTWRVVAGLRYEDYQQVGLIWDPLDFTGSPILTTENQGQEAIAQQLSDAVYVKDDVFASAAATYMHPGFLAEDFQLRFGFSETTVRPDLREIADSSYIDPITGDLVFGNPDLRPAEFLNYDVRAEWFFSNGDNFTASFFYKDITDPIEQFQAAGGEGIVAVEIINADSAEILGFELEFMKTLGEFSPALAPFFVQGNLTMLDTELVAGDEADAPTNAKRKLFGASDQVFNVILGYDSPNEQHAATLSYNYFGERLYFAGRNGQDDAFEQPFHSIDATYSYFPTENLILKLKAKNLLDEGMEIEQGSVTTFEREVGMTFSASVQYQF